MVAVLTVTFGIWTQYEHARSEFEIKAAEIVLKTENASQARDTAIALSKLFPSRLPENFAESFPKNLPNFGPDIISASPTFSTGWLKDQKAQ